MLLNVLWLASKIVADQPDTVQRHINQIGDYVKKAIDGLLGWIAHNPNEFIIALSAAVTAIFTVILAIATIRLWNSTADLALTGEKQIAETRDIFVGERRPWIKVTVKVIEPFRSDGNQALLWLSIKLQNTGNTPALGVSLVVEGHPRAEGGTAQDTYRRLSEFLRHAEPDPRRHLVLFPGDSHIYKDYRALASWHKEQVDAGVQRGSEPDFLSFCVCVNYRSSVGDANYQTGFIFDLLRDDRGRALLRFGLSEPEVPINRLSLGLGGGPVEIYVS
jgi:hypothetical protein